jgi:tRNA1Val (adenine37-N6)-methyltransferase
MGQSYFQFKQFKIEQDQCAMKVSTDACLFGAWIAQLTSICTGDILEIGTGTGLLPLMIQQAHSSLCIDAIEIDEKAAAQAKDNINTCTWSVNIEVIQIDFNFFECHGAKQYDLVISNPPFFANSLKGEDEKKNAALHQTTLTWETILQKAFTCSKEDASLALLLPFVNRAQLEKQLVKNGWYLHQLVAVWMRPNKPQSRWMLLAKKKPTTLIQEESMHVQDNNGEYSERFKFLLQPYYLAF